MCVVPAVQVLSPVVPRGFSQFWRDEPEPAPSDYGGENEDGFVQVCLTSHVSSTSNSKEDVKGQECAVLGQFQISLFYNNEQLRKCPSPSLFFPGRGGLSSVLQAVYCLCVAPNLHSDLVGLDEVYGECSTEEDWATELKESADVHDSPTTINDHISSVAALDLPLAS